VAKLRKSDQRAIVRLYRAGETVRALASRYRVGDYKIHQILWGNGVNMRGCGGSVDGVAARCLDRFHEIVRLRTDGATYAEIGVQFGITRQRVHQILG